MSKTKTYSVSKEEFNWLLKEKYDGKKQKAFFVDLEHLKKGEPLAYIIGNVSFINCIIDLSKRPLIPRYETEYWVKNVIEKIQDDKKFAILDLFSGSGCIGIALAKYFTTSHVTLVDVSSKNIEQIKINIKLNNVSPGQVSIIESDFVSNITETYDLIFANPPYVSKNRVTYIDDSVLKWEPHRALFAEDDGLFYIKALINIYKSLLKPNGNIYIEIDDWQKYILSKILLDKNIPHFFLKDQYKKWRILRIINT